MNMMTLRECAEAEERPQSALAVQEGGDHFLDLLIELEEKGAV